MKRRRQPQCGHDIVDVIEHPQEIPTGGRVYHTDRDNFSDGIRCEGTILWKGERKSAVKMALVRWDDGNDLALEWLASLRAVLQQGEDK